MDYCLSSSSGPDPKNSASQIRTPGPEVLRGSPDMTREIIDSLRFKQKYTSGVVAFHEDDSPSEQQQREVMDKFEDLAFAGLNKEDCNILWIRHTHCGNVELHMVVPRVEMKSGKSLNIAPPGWRNKFDALRDTFNYRHGWARPDDPARARKVQSSPHYRNPELMHREQFKKMIGQLVEKGIQEGEIVDSTGVVDLLKRYGTISRSGKGYTTVRTASGNKYRLKGTYFCKDFQVDVGLVKSLREYKKAQFVGPNIPPAVFAERNLKTAIDRTAVYNTKRYRADLTGSTVSPSISRPLDEFLILSLGADAIFEQEDSGSHLAKLIPRYGQEGRGADYRDSRQSKHTKETQPYEVSDDGTRNAVAWSSSAETGGNGELLQASRAAVFNRFARARRIFDAAGSGLGAALRALTKAHRRVYRELGGVIESIHEQRRAHGEALETASLSEEPSPDHNTDKLPKKRVRNFESPSIR